MILIGHTHTLECDAVNFRQAPDASRGCFIYGTIPPLSRTIFNVAVQETAMSDPDLAPGSSPDSGTDKTESAPAALVPEQVKPRRPMLITPLVVVYLLAGILQLVSVRWGILWGGAQFVIAWGTSKMRRWAWYANLIYCGVSIVGWFMGSFWLPLLVLFLLVAAYMLLPDTRRAFRVGKKYRPALSPDQETGN